MPSWPYCKVLCPGLYDPSCELGNGRCDYWREGYNTEKCSWDFGDCTKHNKLKIEYPECDGDLTFLGDGTCDHLFNNKKCGWDNGDCIEFNKKYPKCKVPYPTYIGDGRCLDYGNYNTKKCAWDGGDCIIHNFKKKHPDCKLDDYTMIGDGKCNKDYYSKACGWDNGDCLSPGAIAGIIIACLFFIYVATCFYLYHNQCRIRIQRFRSRIEPRLHRSHQRHVRLLRSQQRRREFERERRTAMFPLAPPVIAIHEEDQRMGGRHSLVLTSIIHKKVISSKKSSGNGDDHEINILPHEVILSERSTRIINRKMPLLENENNAVEDESADLEAQQSTILQQKKHDIIIETLRSIRAMNDNNIPSSTIESNDTDLYNPKVCPICCEEYVKGDDIAWSKNEECVHAFHTDCIVPWLMEHSDCPMCRNDYLCLS